jgi:hypothetical protein
VGVGIVDFEEAPLTIDDAGGSIGGIALGGDPLIPVVERSRRGFSLDLLKPGILARWLVEMPMHTQITFGHGASPV